MRDNSERVQERCGKRRGQALRKEGEADETHWALWLLSIVLLGL